ncbi:GNAT family N-acetyltransferase [Homoserinibacter sp. GY 40078]|uniref:GNAT family N-acetyltransferase n=1 Tax=Homoserinibacter sp. GY 40078 TaxID=2603275 RepID=UPI0011C85EA4|nr:GNAT family N-acetyltransferase [Homoserinibacter sp. GY 40078]TXK17015.1 GNAT family N-acetyltransferase [Homoserinibacter sp. GY 40078]
MDDIEVIRLEVPERLGDDDASRDFAEVAEVRNTCEELAYGTPDVGHSVGHLQRYWADPNEHSRLLGVRIDGRIVAYALASALIADPSASWLETRVLPEHRGRGIGTALADAAEAEARALGSTHAVAYVPSADAAGDTVAPSSGVGALPAHNPEVRFLIARGYELEQVVRASRLELPVDPVALPEQLGAADRHAGDDYRAVSWVGVTPEEWRDDLAVLHTRMSTDAPQSGLGEPEDVWTAARIAEDDAASVRAGLAPVTAGAVHVPSGRLIAYTQLIPPIDVTRPIEQHDTLVLREHRGHGLGMLVKLANLELLAQVRPGHPSILTWNAEENTHMLAVNERIGFERMGGEGAWRRELQ